MAHTTRPRPNRIALFLVLTIAVLLAPGCRKSPPPFLAHEIMDSGRGIARAVGAQALLAYDSLNRWPTPADTASWARVIQITGELNFDWTTQQRADTMGVEVRDRKYGGCYSIRVTPQTQPGELRRLARGPHKCGQALAVAPAVTPL